MFLQRKERFYYGINKKELNEFFEILIEEIKNIINELNHEFELENKSNDFNKITKIEERITKFISIIEKLQELKKECDNMFNNIDLKKEWNRIFMVKNSKITSRKKFVKLEKGLKTPEKEFRIPILEALVELGGKAEAKEVLKIVEQKLKEKLNKYDYENIPSDPHKIRWKDTARWCRNTLVNEGLLSSNSPKGIWEITEKGRKYLEDYKKRIENNDKILLFEIKDRRTRY